jgi:hypothetical protein
MAVLHDVGYGASLKVDKEYKRQESVIEFSQFTD